MKVASVIFREQDFHEVQKNKELLLLKILSWLKEAQINKVKLLLCPGLIGNLYEGDFVKEVINMSHQFPDLRICPGSWWEKESSQTYHSSGLIRNGEWLIKHKQLYLARWEKELGLVRGHKVESYQLEDFLVGLQVSTEVFYPPVSRYQALSGINLVLAPVAIVGEPNFYRQISGLWPQVQQNLFYALESGFKGFYKGRQFYSEAAIHAPLVLTNKKDGFIARENRVKDSESLLIADLNFEELEKAAKGFDPRTQLNPSFYRKG